MRVIILFVAITLAALGGRAVAQPSYELNRIRGNVNFVERGLAEGNLDSARFYTRSAREDMAKASAETKADPEFARIKARLDKLEKDLVVREAGAAKQQVADEKLSDADSAERDARFQLGQDEPEKALAHYQRCVTLLEEAFAADPGAREREAGHHKAGALDKTCRDGVIAAGKAASGEGRTRAADTEEGKAAVAAFEAVVLAMDGKKLKQETLVAGVRGMDECRNKLGQLSGQMRRNGKRFYDTATEKLKTSRGELSMDEIDQWCAKAQRELKGRTATGCGRKYTGISQIRLRGGGWSTVQGSSGPANMSYEGVDCADMPKRSSFPGLSARFKAKFQTACGPRGVYVIQHNDWVTNPDKRFMAGDCYARGELGFFK